MTVAKVAQALLDFTDTDKHGSRPMTPEEVSLLRDLVGIASSRSVIIDWLKLPLAL